MSLNAICIMGRMVANPELRRTQNGTEVCGFTLAVDRDFKNGAERDTDFIDCVAFGKTAVFVCRYFTKGSLMAVNGRLQVRTGTTRDGEKRRFCEVVAESVYFGGGKPEGKRETHADYEEMEDETDLPF